MLALLQRIHEEGISWTVWDFERHFAHGLGRPGFEPPTRITSAMIGQVLLWEYQFAEAMAAEYDPDSPRGEAELERFRQTERNAAEQRAMMWRAMGGPTGDAALGDTDGYLRWETSNWRRTADTLREELGDSFIDGTTAQRADKVRDWVREYRSQSRLPRRRPPA